MKLYKNAYFSKSFYMMGDSLAKCYNCQYCRVIDSTAHYEQLPTDINLLFAKIPVAVNLFYGDPTLQIDNTVKYLKLLEPVHKAPVILVTKGDISTLMEAIKDIDLDIHIGLSTFGNDHRMDGGSLRIFEHNLDICSKHKFKFSIEYRPVIRDINDSYEHIEHIYSLASKYNTCVSFCGLQVNDNLQKYFDKNNINIKPYTGYEFGLKKSVSKEVEDMFYMLGDKYGVATFRKTSCAVTYMHNLERDYNAHYYRPNEMRCAKCPNMSRCMSFKAKNDKREKLDIDLPFEYELITKQKHTCILHTKGICKFANNDCKNISGKMIKINEKITSSDLRVIKWLTGYTTDCDFEEIEYISTNWLN